MTDPAGSIQRAVILGAGAVGSYLGARLAVPTTLVARPDHARAVARDGLRITGVMDEAVPLDAVDTMPPLKADTLVLVTVKLPDLAAAAAQLGPALRPDTRVAVAANGLEPDAELARALGRPVQRIIVDMGVTLEKPGTVAYWGGSGLQLGPGEAEDELATLLGASGFAVTRCEDLAVASWRKFAVNCVMNPLSVITGRSNREIIAPDLADLRRHIVEEVRQVAAASGVDLPADLAERIDRAMSGSGNRTSMLQDFERGRATEIDHLNGWVARRAPELGLAAPVNRMMAEKVRLAVENRRQG